MYFCAGYIENPWGGNPKAEAARGQNSALTRGLPLNLHLPARVAKVPDVVVVPDDDDHDGDGVSGASVENPRKSLRPKHKAAMPSYLTPKPKA